MQVIVILHKSLTTTAFGFIIDFNQMELSWYQEKNYSAARALSVQDVKIGDGDSIWSSEIEKIRQLRFLFLERL